MYACFIEEVEGDGLEDLCVERDDEPRRRRRRYCPTCPDEPFHERAERAPYDGFACAVVPWEQHAASSPFRPSFAGSSV